MKIGIIGGGASGMVAAITAARVGAEVVLLEKNDRIGKKILVTGNGKCNLSNLSFSASCYYSKERERAWELVSLFTPQDTIAFFEKLGLMIKEKNGYLYPACEQASAVLDVLRYEITARGIEVRCSEEIKELFPEKGGGFRVCSKAGTERFERVIVSCGGQASPKTGSDGAGFRLLKKLGFSIVRPVPALVQLRCEGSFKALAGIRCEARIRLFIDGRETASETGELQMTEYGISGIPVFQLSRHAAYGLSAGRVVTAGIDLLPGLSGEKPGEWVKKRLALLPGRTAEEFLTGTLHKKWILYFLKRHGIRQNDIASEIAEKKWLSLICEAKDWRVRITDTNSFENAQVCAGGVSLREVTKDLESVRYPGLYVTGELLDVDGRCGGYNLQWAWTSGVLAGRAAAGEIVRETKR